MADEPDFKRPESVLVLVYTAGGEVLVLRRRSPAWFWQSITGSLRKGESPRSAAERELFEETGLAADGRLVDCKRSVTFPIVAPWRERYAADARTNREHWFLLPLAARRTPRLSLAEHTEYRWLSAADAWRRVSSWSNRRVIGDLFRTR